MANGINCAIVQEIKCFQGYTPAIQRKTLKSAAVFGEEGVEAILLASRAEAVVSTQEVLREIWSGGSVSDSRALWTLISRLRRKLKSESSHLEISSKRGSGYALEQI